MSNYVNYEALKIASKYYSDKQLAHAIRVAEYAVENTLFTDDTDKRLLWTTGILHDIFEDTNCETKELSLYLPQTCINAVKILTHNKKSQSYEEYILNIIESNNPYALAVKRADMKDHLMQEETLTQKLKDKYYPIIKYLF